MIGDGANDLLAIKEADIGIGISNSDASYAATFTVQELFALDYIVREAKNSQRVAIEILRYLGIFSFLSVVLIVIMATEAAFFSPVQLLYIGLTKSILFSTALALSRPAEHQTIHTPSSNFLRA